MSIVRCEKEYGYTSLLAAVAGQYCSLSVEDLPSATQYRIVWVQRYDQIYVFDKLQHWAREIIIERDINRQAVTHIILWVGATSSIMLFLNNVGLCSSYL